MPKLYLVHCGFSQKTLPGAIFESHVDFFVAADDFDEAKTKAKALPLFRQHKMHVDGLLEVNAVGGYRIRLKADQALRGADEIASRHGFAFPGKKKKSAPV